MGAFVENHFRKKGILKAGFYHSLWAGYERDFPGYENDIKYMLNTCATSVAELLTNYGGNHTGTWFDGAWDQGLPQPAQWQYNP